MQPFYAHGYKFTPVIERRCYACRGTGNETTDSGHITSCHECAGCGRRCIRTQDDRNHDDLVYIQGWGTFTKAEMAERAISVSEEVIA